MLPKVPPSLLKGRLRKPLMPSESNERAWVEIEPIKPILVSPADAKFSAAFTCNIYPKNVGKTIATDVLVKAEDSSSGEELGSNRAEMANIQDNYLLDKFTEMGTGKPVHVAQNPVPKVLAPNTVSAAPFRLTCQAPQIFSNGTQVLHYLNRAHRLLRPVPS